ncbi:MAG TPA: limonene-1,2-epoxide hydrolase family protein, partial [Acidimicrobiales bacterium]
MTTASRATHNGTHQVDDIDAPVEVVTRFLTALQDGEVETVIDLVADDLVYTNVSLPSIRGKERFSRAVRAY